MSLTRKYNLILSGLIMAWLFLMPGQMVLAEDTTTGVNKALGGLKTTGEKGLGSTDANLYPTGGLPEIIGKVVGAALAFLGVAFFILMIYGGYMWMFSMGNEQTTTKAKEIIIAAVVGLIIVLLAYAITSYIGSVVGAAK